VLFATESGDHPFDEACSTTWTRLAARVAPTHPLPPACAAVTVELRGEVDVSHSLAAHDADALVAYMAWLGAITPAGPASAPLPRLACEPTPLAGSMPVEAPHAGVLAWHRDVGAHVAAGESLADLVDPLSAQVTLLKSPVDGVLYARERRRFVPAGGAVARVAGREAVRKGKLLSE
jgi:predicted deacylase